MMKATPTDREAMMNSDGASLPIRPVRGVKMSSVYKVQPEVFDDGIDQTHASDCFD